VVLLLGYPGVGKRTVGYHLTQRLDGVLVDNALINLPVLTALKWDGKAPLPTDIWDRMKPIRAAVLSTITDLAPPTISYVFSTVLTDDVDGATQYDELRNLARRRGALFQAVMLACDPAEQARRIDTPDRRARLKGTDPEGHLLYSQQTALLQPAEAELLRLDTTSVTPQDTATKIYKALGEHGFQP
jgi:shikimate kinase